MIKKLIVLFSFITSILPSLMNAHAFTGTLWESTDPQHPFSILLLGDYHQESKAGYEQSKFWLDKLSDWHFQQKNIHFHWECMNVNASDIKSTLLDFRHTLNSFLQFLNFLPKDSLMAHTSIDPRQSIFYDLIQLTDKLTDDFPIQEKKEFIKQIKATFESFNYFGKDIHNALYAWRQNLADIFTDLGGVEKSHTLTEAVHNLFSAFCLFDTNFEQLLNINKSFKDIFLSHCEKTTFKDIKENIFLLNDALVQDFFDINASAHIIDAVKKKKNIITYAGNAHIIVVNDILDELKSILKIKKVQYIQEKNTTGLSAEQLEDIVERFELNIKSNPINDTGMSAFGNNNNPQKYALIYRFIDHYKENM